MSVDSHSKRKMAELAFDRVRSNGPESGTSTGRIWVDMYIIR